MKYKNIIISFEDEQHDLPVLEHALDIAERNSARLSLFHINSSKAGYPSRAMRPLEHRYTQGELREIVEKLPFKVPVDIRLIKSDNTVAEIAKASKDFDLLVLGHRHATFIEMILGDSIDERIINKVDCDCLVVKQI